MTPPAEPAAGTDAQPLAFKAVRGGLWVALSAYWTIGFGFVINLILTRLLAPEAFGAFALAQFFVSLLDLRPKSGVNQAFAQRQESTDELVGTHFVLDLAISLAGLLLMLAALPILRTLGYAPNVTWIALALAGVNIANAVTSTAWILLDKHLLFGRVSQVSSIAFPLSYLPAVLLALRDAGAWSLVAQNASYALLLLVGLWLALRRDLPHFWQGRWGGAVPRWHFSGAVARAFLRFGIVVGLASLAGMVLIQFDNFLVGTFVSLQMLGFYDRAYRIAQWPHMLISNVLVRTAFYTYAQLQNDPVRLSKSVAMTFWLIALLALPLALAIFVAAPDLVRLFYSERWLPSALFVRFLVVYSLLRPVFDLAGSLFVAVGKPQHNTLVLATQAAALVLFATPLTLRYGAIGTAVGVGLAFSVGLLLAYHYMRRTVALSWRETLWPPVIAAILATAGYVLLSQLIDLNLLPLVARVLLKMVLVAGLYFGSLFLVHPRTLIERMGYLWRLLRGVQPQSTPE